MNGVPEIKVGDVVIVTSASGVNEGEVIKVLTSFNEKHKQDTMQTYHISKCRPFVDKYPKDVARRITEIIASKK